MFTYVYVCYIFIYLCIHISVYMCRIMGVCVYVYRLIYVRVRIDRQVDIQIFKPTLKHSLSYTHINTCKYTHTHTHTYIYIYIERERERHPLGSIYLTVPQLCMDYLIPKPYFFEYALL